VLEDNIISSDNYYLRPHDVVVVAPLKARSVREYFTGTLSVFSIITGAAAVVTTFLLLNQRLDNNQLKIIVPVDFNNAQNNFSLGKLAGKILRKWYWLALSIGVCLAAAYMVNRYTVPTYKVSSSVFVKNKDPFSAQEVLLEESGSGPSKNLYNEKYFLKSRRLIEKAMRELDSACRTSRKRTRSRWNFTRKAPSRYCPTRLRSSFPYYETIRCTALTPRSTR
jgi:hypothetical protein